MITAHSTFTIDEMKEGFRIFRNTNLRFRFFNRLNLLIVRFIQLIMVSIPFIIFVAFFLFENRSRDLGHEIIPKIIGYRIFFSILYLLYLGVLGVFFLFSRKSSKRDFIDIEGACERNAEKEMKNSSIYGQELNWSFDAQGFKLAREENLQNYSWQKIDSVVIAPNGVLIIPKKRVIFWIPVEGFASPEDFQTVRGYIQQSGVKTKIR